MDPTIDFGRLETALASPGGRIELALAVVCVLVAWLISRRFAAREPRHAMPERLRTGLTRIVFPLAALVLVFVARVVYQRYFSAPVLLDIVFTLAFALLVIRVVGYGLRTMFPGAAWLATSERAITLAVWVFVALHFLGLAREIAAAADQLRLPIGRNEVSLLTIAEGAAAVGITILVTLWVSGLIEQRLMRTQLDRNVRVVLAKATRAVLLVVGVLIALQAIGFDLTLLTVFGGALAVGIGLGLQKLAANYIAGFTILLDRSIKLGDMVTVDARFGVVTEVTSRYVVVRGLDGVEAIVPNETLVTTTVLNHSHTTREIRLSVGVTVSYDADVDLALRLMVEAASSQPRVLRGERAPQGFIAGLGDNGIQLELGVWINDPENGQLNLRSAIHREMLGAFRRNAIAMPPPQRDVRFTTPLTVLTGAEPAQPGAVPRAGTAPT